MCGLYLRLIWLEEKEINQMQRKQFYIQTFILRSELQDNSKESTKSGNYVLLTR